eukprot:958959-Rhodomonas_salina.1
MTIASRVQRTLAPVSTSVFVGAYEHGVAAEAYHIASISVRRVTSSLCMSDPSSCNPAANVTFDAENGCGPPGNGCVAAKKGGVAAVNERDASANASTASVNISGAAINSSTASINGGRDLLDNDGLRVDAELHGVR